MPRTKVGARRGPRVVVIGGGASGALISARLAEQGCAVVALEKAAIGNGSSSRSAACIRAQWGVAETVIGMLYSEWFYVHFHDLMRSPPDDRPWLIKQNGYLFLYEDPDQAAPPWQPSLRRSAAAAWHAAQAQAAMQRDLGCDVSLLTPNEIQRRWPHLDAARLVGATWGPNDGFLNHDLIYRRGFARARELGVELRQHAEVTGAEVRGGRIVAVQTTAGRVEGDWFVNAAGAWAPRVSRALGGMDLSIAPLKRFLYFLKPDRPIMSSAAWEALPMTIYGVGPGRGAHSRPDGASLLIGWSHEADPEPAFTDADQDVIPPAFHHAHGIDNYGYAALAEVERFAPALANCGGLHATTCGYYEMTPDGMPLIGNDARLSNLVHAAGFSGHGLMHAPVTALLTAAIITGDVADGAVTLPAPFVGHRITLAAFDPARDFQRSRHEALVL
jgi:sarcosine oxidase subunit beta